MNPKRIKGSDLRNIHRLRGVAGNISTARSIIDQIEDNKQTCNIQRSAETRQSKIDFIIIMAEEGISKLGSDNCINLDNQTSHKAMINGQQEVNNLQGSEQDHFMKSND